MALAGLAHADEQDSLTGQVCGSGFATSHTDIDPDAASELELTRTLSSTVRKGCRGALTAPFAAETVGRILLQAVATCVGSGGGEEGCAVGTQARSIFGEGPHHFGSQDSSVREARGAMFVLKDLKRGAWRIDLSANDGGDAAARIGRRSLIITAYKGG